MTHVRSHLYPSFDDHAPVRSDFPARISLVGAGPGDPDLITRKGLKALQSAAVVLYDALIHPALLEEAPPSAKLIYVGKRAGRHSMSQDNINRLLVRCARRFGHTVRLKGGDPFVFGRGQEELQYARSRGIEVAVIPGISSSIALMSLQGIPPTHRGLSQSFWVITARAANGELPGDLSLAASSNATVIILMGLGRLERILELYRQAGKGAMPVMIIQNGSRANERSWLGTVNTIAASFLRERDAGPGIIIIGEVVSLHPELLTEEVRSLAPRRLNVAE